MSRKYDAYLASEDWRTRCELFWQHHDRSCSICGTDQRLTVHHLSYENLGNEPVDDLLGLCWDHHQALHRYADAHPEFTLRQASSYFVEAAGGSAPDPGEGRPAPKRHLEWLANVVAPCPTCGAEAGSGCVKLERGRPRVILGIHSKRKAAARKAARS